MENGDLRTIPKSNSEMNVLIHHFDNETQAIASTATEIKEVRPTGLDENTELDDRDVSRFNEISGNFEPYRLVEVSDASVEEGFEGDPSISTPWTTIASEIHDCPIIALVPPNSDLNNSRKAFILKVGPVGFEPTTKGL